jgi:hypothetical protein
MVLRLFSMLLLIWCLTRPASAMPLAEMMTQGSIGS